MSDYTRNICKDGEVIHEEVISADAVIEALLGKSVVEQAPPTKKKNFQYKNPAKKGRGHALSEEIKQAIAGRLRSGDNVGKVAGEYGVSQSTISKIIRDYEVYKQRRTRSNGEPPAAQPRVGGIRTVDAVELPIARKIMDLARDGIATKTIAERLGIDVADTDAVIALNV